VKGGGGVRGWERGSNMCSERAGIPDRHLILGRQQSTKGNWADRIIFRAKKTWKLQNMERKGKTQQKKNTGTGDRKQKKVVNKKKSWGATAG